MALAAADNAGNFHGAAFDKINAVAGRALAENLLAGGDFFSCAMSRSACNSLRLKLRKSGMASSVVTGSL